MPLPKAPTQLGDLLEDYDATNTDFALTPHDKKTEGTAKQGKKSRARSALSAEQAPTLNLEEPPFTLTQTALPAVDTPVKKAKRKTKATQPIESVQDNAPETSSAPIKATPQKTRAKKTESRAKAPEKTAQPALNGLSEVEKEAQATPEATTPAVTATKGTKARTPTKKGSTKAASAPQSADTAKAVTPDQTSVVKAEEPVAPVGEELDTTPNAKSLDDLVLPLRGASSRITRHHNVGDGLKLFVLDTNVLMHDPQCLFRFEEHDVFIPMTVLEELDNHKKGTTDVARNARSVSRSLDQLTERHPTNFDEGIALNLLGNVEAKGRLFIETSPIAEPLPMDLPLTKADNHILATAKGAIKRFPERTIVLVTKDINMRIKASVLGLASEDYLSDKVIDDTALLFTGHRQLPSKFWDTVADSLVVNKTEQGTIYEFTWDEAHTLVLNECLTVLGDGDFMGIVVNVDGKKVQVRALRDYQKRLRLWGIHSRNAEQNMALNLLMDPNIDFVTILGQAGTGKTLLALAAALAQIFDTTRYSDVLITRATVSLGEDIGYLPGSEEEKMTPWMGAIEDNLEVLLSTGGSSKLTAEALKKRIQIKSMSFMRGRTFLKKFVIIDEAQNLSPKQMKALITRAGPGTKIVCLGNLAQIDTPYLTEGSSGLTYVVERFQNWRHGATITLARSERSRLAQYAVSVL